MLQVRNGYGEVISQRQLLPSLICKVVDQLGILPILSHQSFLRKDHKVVIITEFIACSNEEVIIWDRYSINGYVFQDFNCDFLEF